MVQRARHANGTPYDAQEVEPGSQLKAGPWSCEGEGCTVVFAYHRAASFAVGDPNRVLRQATFVHGKERGHSLSCKYNAEAERQRLLNEHGGIISRRGNTMHLKWGVGPTPGEQSTPAEPRAAGKVREPYAAIMACALDITRVIDRFGEAALQSYFVNHQGVQYTWSKILYGPTAIDLARLTPHVQQVFTIGPWPRLVRGMVADGGELNEKGNSISVKMRAIDTLPDAGGYVRFRLFAKPGTPAGDRLLQLRSSSTVYAILADDWRYLDGLGTAVVTITDPGQIALG